MTSDPEALVCLALVQHFNPKVHFGPCRAITPVADSHHIGNRAGRHQPHPDREPVPRMGEGMIIEQMSISAPPGKSEQLCSALAALTSPIEVLPGCLSCRVLQSCQDPSEIFIQVKWATTEELIHHLQSETYKRLLLLMELSPKPPLLQFYMVEEVRGLDLVKEARASAG